MFGLSMSQVNILEMLSDKLMDAWAPTRWLEAPGGADVEGRSKSERSSLD